MISLGYPTLGEVFGINMPFAWLMKQNVKKCILCINWNSLDNTGHISQLLSVDKSNTDIVPKQTHMDCLMI